MATWGELEKAGTKWRDLEEMTWGELEEFCVINPKTKQIPDDMEVSFVPMQSVSDTGAVQTDEVRKASEVKKGFTFFEEGDVLFAKITPCMENGKGGIARGLKNGVGFGSTEFHVLHPAPEKVSSEWLYYLTSWDEFRKQCARNMTGSAGQKRVPKSYLEHYKVYLPPLDEQRRIAAVLDKVSDLIAKRREQLDKLDELVKARFVEMFGDPVLNPMDWPTYHLADMADIVSGITKGRKTKEQDLIEVPYMAVSNVKNGYIDWTTIKTILATQSEIDQYRLLPDDVLMTEGGDPDKLGRGAIIQKPLENCIHQNHIFRVRLNENMILPVYFAEFLQHQKAKQYFLRCAKQTTGIASINMAQLKGLPTLVPPRALQMDFTNTVEQINKSKLTIQQSLDKLEVLKKALMQQYFGVR